MQYAVADSTKRLDFAFSMWCYCFMLTFNKEFLYMIIQNGKNWIFSHNVSQHHGDLIAQYLLERFESAKQSNIF